MTTTATPIRRKRNKKPLKTNIIFVIDKSGSMITTAKDVCGGFNAYVEHLKEDGNDYSLTAILFDTTVGTLFADLPLDQVPELSAKSYRPSGNTGLYDAIGHGFAVAKERWSTKSNPYGKDRVIFIIMTDGEENSSRVFHKDGIVSEIKAREEAKNWTFVYMGADQDAWDIASGLGLAQGNTMSYTGDQSKEAFSVAAAATSTTSSTSQTQTRSFFHNP